MNINLFKLALEHLEPSDWNHFEILSSAFLSVEFDEMRTMAHPSGDGGRDSELYTPNAKPFICAQYSIAENWKTKISQTITRISSEFPDIRILIYMTNQLIGARADDLRNQSLKSAISLDVRDRTWFLERAVTHTNREMAAEQLIERIARPYLRGEQIIEKGTTPLNSNESRAALLYLGFQLQDDHTDKGLTKLCFDALVRAALRHTNSDRRLPRKEIHQWVVTALPSTDKSTVIKLTDAALSRLAKRFVRHWQQEDSFCLTYEESQRMIDQLTQVESQMIDLSSSLRDRISTCLSSSVHPSDSEIQDLQTRIQKIIQILFLKGGELFVEALQSGTLSRIGLRDLDDIILNDLQNSPTTSKLLPEFPSIIRTVIKDLLSDPSETTYLYLRRLSHSYTLFSFLNHTPDVQEATRKLFSHGTIWVDTTILLPLFAEFLDNIEHGTSLSSLFRLCRDAGIELRITRGIIQEIEAHMGNALLCSEYSTTAWKGRVPYLFNQYLLHAQTPLSFRQWLDQFRGHARPQDDLLQFLSESFGFQLQDLDAEESGLPEDFRFAVDRLWSEAHKKRRQKNEPETPSTDILIKHDIETYLGVIGLRQNESVSELGYRHWLLTLDTVAWEIRDYLRKEKLHKITTSPLLSLSFLINSMAFGPNRQYISKDSFLSLPMILDIEMADSMPHDILAIAEKIRKEYAGQPEFVIKRKVRDAIDAARHRGFGTNSSANPTS